VFRFSGLELGAVVKRVTGSDFPVDRRALREGEGPRVVGSTESVEDDAHPEGPWAAARVENVRHLVGEGRDVFLLLRHDAGKPVRKGLCSFPAHGAKYNPIFNMASPRSTDADARRRIPSVDQVMQSGACRDLETRFGRGPVLKHVRAILAEARGLAAAGAEAAAPVLGELAATLERRLEAASAPSLVRVINATGVIVHTNLGRAPLSAEAAARVAAIARSYSNLEYDLATGERGDREVHVESRLAGLLGSEATAVVNNCAAAVLLAVNTFAEGREVLVSRGELVEIGGSFRIPEILRKGGGRLREVGTTNKTRLADYRAALSPETGLILKVHRSNFDIVGFTETPGREELADLARSAGVPLVEDLGSGLLEAPHPLLAQEPTVTDALAAGVDVVAFSGDKLLGGPQAGLLAGKTPRVAAMRRNPLYRALRVDKMTLAALDAVVVDHVSDRAAERVPALAMASLGAETLRARAQGFAERVRALGSGLEVTLAEGASAVGGGAAPTLRLPTTLVTLAHPSLSPDRLAEALRAGAPAVVGRVGDGRFVLDLRTVPVESEGELLEALRRAAAPR
jgi:L-seryl-tRNA(Ser) seleniumtransferase